MGRLGALVLSGTLGLAGCAEQSRSNVLGADWYGSILYIYEDNDGDEGVDNVSVRFVSSVTTGCMGYDRSPTEREIKRFSK